MEQLIKLINGQAIQLLLFAELREQALKEAIKDNRVAIGKWIKDNNYIKTNKMVNNVRYVGYYKENLK